MGVMSDVESQRREIYNSVSKLNAYPFWLIQGDMEPREPRVREKAHVWRFKDFEPLIQKAGPIVPHELADRRAFVLHNPGYDMTKPYTTNTQYIAYSFYLPGEVFEPHVHTPSASRMLLQSDGKGYTTVEGEKCYLERGDLVITPSGSWHDHGNEGEIPMIWVDMLDIPVPVLFNAAKFGFDYRENGKKVDRQSATRSHLYSKRHFSFGGVRPRFAQTEVGNRTSSPQLHWKYADVRAALNAVRDEPGDPYDGVIVDYVDVMTGGPIQKTQNFSMQLLRPGEHTMSHRHSNGGVYVCIEGSGHTIINGEEFAWAENDVFCVPSMHWHEHVNGSDKEDAVLYCVSDAPALEKLGLLWEERKTATGEIVAIGNALPS
jgi:gentisate 1,2-dioxygenase